jgi:monoamine oxidase
VNALYRCATTLERLELEAVGVRLDTNTGSIRARAAIVTVSTAVLAGEAIHWPTAMQSWCDAAYALPLGRNEKLFLQIAAGAGFENETQLLGNPRDPATGAYYIRPFDWPVIECFLGGDGAELVAREGEAAGFAHALDELAALMGGDVRRFLRPIAASNWTVTPRIGGAYSCALPEAAAERLRLARPLDDRIFFAGEATSATDFSTAHGAYASGVRAACEAARALGRHRR